MLVYTPKVLEKKPIVMGFDLATVVVLIANALLFVFTAFTNFIVSLLFVAIAVLFFVFKMKFRSQAELAFFIKYKTTPQCVIMDKQISDLLKKD